MSVSRARAIAAAKGALRGRGQFRGLLIGQGAVVARTTARERELKARLKRARTATVKPKGRLPNPDLSVTELRRLIKEAEKVLRQFKAAYGLRTEYYQDQISYIKALKEWLASKTRRNPGFFGSEAVAKAKRVTKVRRVMERDTKQPGEIIGVQPGGFLKVKWDNRERSTLIKRSEIKRYPYVRVNPGLMELAGSVQALEYLADKAGPGRKRKRKNPSVREMSTRFQGRASGQAEEFYFSDSAPRLDFSRGGQFVFIKLKGTTIRVANSVVAIDPVTEKLWLGTKNQNGMFKRKAKQGEGLDHGPVDEICYLTAKKHIGGGKPYEYHHRFGEDGGRKPTLIIDHDGMPILKGGDYKIEARGIVN